MSGMNPLDKPGEVFELALMNPNPTSSKTKDGPVYRVSFELEQEQWQQFMDGNTKGMIIAAKCCVAADGQSEVLNQPAESKGPYGQNSRMLIASGFFEIKQVWDALGGDDAYQEWCRHQPCVISGDFDYSEDYPEGRNVYAHVRRSGEAGTGYKPVYSGAPMRNKYHRVQHNSGESAVYAEYLILSGQSNLELAFLVTRQGLTAEAKEWFLNQAKDHIKKWVMSSIKRIMMVDSMTNLDPVTMRRYCEQMNIDQYLPVGY